LPGSGSPPRLRGGVPLIRQSMLRLRLRFPAKSQKRHVSMDARVKPARDE
jgi:hypothetical protein